MTDIVGFWIRLDEPAWEQWDSAWNIFLLRSGTVALAPVGAVGREDLVGALGKRWDLNLPTDPSDKDSWPGYAKRPEVGSIILFPPQLAGQPAYDLMPHRPEGWIEQFDSGVRKLFRMRPLTHPRLGAAVVDFLQSMARDGRP